MAKLHYERDDGESADFDLTSPVQAIAAMDVIEAEVKKLRPFWIIKIGGDQLRIVDFPPGIMQVIADQNPGAFSPMTVTTWGQIVSRPLDNLGVAQVLVARAAEILGVPAPPPAATVDALTDFFDFRPSDLPEPEPVEGGDPPTSSETSTTGSPD